MIRPAAGNLDRRITVEVSASSFDDAGDEVFNWTFAFKLYAQRSTTTGVSGAGIEKTTPQGVIRQAEVRWLVRYGPKSRSIDPELNRIIYQGRVYEILGIIEGQGRESDVIIRTAVRPDGRGPRGPDHTGT